MGPANGGGQAVCLVSPPEVWLHLWLSFRVCAVPRHPGGWGEGKEPQKWVSATKEAFGERKLKDRMAT